MAYDQQKFVKLLTSIQNDTCTYTRLDLNLHGLDNADFRAFVIAIRQSKKFKHNLEVLNLDNNEISDFGDFSFAEFPALLSLKLSYNKLTKFPDLTGCTGLAVLDLSCNRIAGKIPEINLPAVKSIDLRANRITINPKIEKCTKLQYLNLESNLLADFTPDNGYEIVRDLWIKAGNALTKDANKKLEECRKSRTKKVDLLQQFMNAAQNLQAPSPKKKAPDENTPTPQA
jgi:Leucine-rich repeat (LRR) protein